MTDHPTLRPSDLAVGLWQLERQAQFGNTAAQAVLDRMNLLEQQLAEYQPPAILREMAELLRDAQPAAGTEKECTDWCQRVGAVLAQIERLP
jgi:hypothetical protein